MLTSKHTHTKIYIHFLLIQCRPFPLQQKKMRKRRRRRGKYWFHVLSNLNNKLIKYFRCFVRYFLFVIAKEKTFFLFFPFNILPLACTVFLVIFIGSCWYNISSVGHFFIYILLFPSFVHIYSVGYWCFNNINSIHSERTEIDANEYHLYWRKNYIFFIRTSNKYTFPNISQLNMFQ